MTTYKENVRSFATRARSDIKQIEYQLDLLIFGTSEFQSEHIKSIREYMKKLEEHLSSAEKMLLATEEITK